MDVPSSVLKGDYNPRHFWGLKIVGEKNHGGTVFLNVQVRCRRSAAHSWRDWNCPDFCPRCGTLISKPADSGIVSLWD